LRADGLCRGRVGRRETDLSFKLRDLRRAGTAVGGAGAAELYRARIANEEAAMDRTAFA